MKPRCQECGATLPDASLPLCDDCSAALVADSERDTEDVTTVNDESEASE